MSTTLPDIILHLQHTEQMHQQIAQTNISARIRALQNWQTQRLLITHEDLWQSKRFKPAMQFFIDELYGPRDFSERDNELARVVPKMAKILPAKALISLEAALKLNCLSLELDMSLIHALGDAEINRVSYFDGYRACNNRPKRETQIQLLENLGDDLAQVVKISGISTILLLSRKPAKVAGVKSLHEFLENGFKAFKKLGDVNDFMGPIISRERLIMQQLCDAKEANDNPLPNVKQQ